MVAIPAEDEARDLESGACGPAAGGSPRGRLQSVEHEAGGRGENARGEKDVEDAYSATLIGSDLENTPRRGASGPSGDKLYHVNLKGPVRLAALVARQMQQQGPGGRIVNVATVGA